MVPAEAGPSHPTDMTEDEATSLLSIRSILLSEEKKRIDELERALVHLRQVFDQQSDRSRQQVNDLNNEISSLQKQLHESKQQVYELTTELEILRRKSQHDSEGLIARITPVLGELIGRSVRDSRDDIAEALGPVMGEAIRVQIRNSRKEMVEALYPVIGATVQRAITEFTRELQRNIDARLKNTLGPQGMIRNVWARVRGVSASQLTLRDSLPFHVQEAFLIQHGSGLLLAHRHTAGSESPDADLISGMLTAIRDFIHDAFSQGGDDKELDEIQYSDQRIIILSGQEVYLAVVIKGIEPGGFREKLRQYISELELKHGSALRQYQGDPATLPNLETRLSRLLTELTQDNSALPVMGASPMSRGMRTALGLGIFFTILLAAVACFYIQFTVALFPVAFPSPTPTQTLVPSPTPSVTPTASITPSQTATSTFTPTHTPTPTQTTTPTLTLTPTMTLTPTATATPTLTFTPSPSPTPFEAYAIGNVWTRGRPHELAPWIIALPENTPVKVISAYGSWYEIVWTYQGVPQHGWVPAIWIAVREPVPANRITPVNPP